MSWSWSSRGAQEQSWATFRASDLARSVNGLQLDVDEAIQPREMSYFVQLVQLNQAQQVNLKVYRHDGIRNIQPLVKQLQQEVSSLQRITIEIIMTSQDQDAFSNDLRELLSMPNCPVTGLKMDNTLSKVPGHQFVQRIVHALENSATSLQEIVLCRIDFHTNEQLDAVVQSLAHCTMLQHFVLESCKLHERSAAFLVTLLTQQQQEQNTNDESTICHAQLESIRLVPPPPPQDHLQGASGRRRKTSLYCPVLDIDLFAEAAANHPQLKTIHLPMEEHEPNMEFIAPLLLMPSASSNNNIQDITLGDVSCIKLSRRQPIGTMGNDDADDDERGGDLEMILDLEPHTLDRVLATVLPQMTQYLFLLQIIRPIILTRYTIGLIKNLFVNDEKSSHSNTRLGILRLPIQESEIYTDSLMELCHGWAHYTHLKEVTLQIACSTTTTTTPRNSTAPLSASSLLAGGFCPCSTLNKVFLALEDTLDSVGLVASLLNEQPNLKNLGLRLPSPNNAAAMQQEAFSSTPEHYYFAALGEAIARHSSLTQLSIDGGNDSMISTILAQLVVKNDNDRTKKLRSVDLSNAGHGWGVNKDIKNLIEATTNNGSIENLYLPPRLFDTETMHELYPALMGNTSLVELEQKQQSAIQNSASGSTPTRTTATRSRLHRFGRISGILNRNKRLKRVQEILNQRGTALPPALWPRLLSQLGSSLPSSPDRQQYADCSSTQAAATAAISPLYKVLKGGGASIIVASSGSAVSSENDDDQG